MLIKLNKFAMICYDFFGIVEDILYSTWVGKARLSKYKYTMYFGFEFEPMDCAPDVDLIRPLALGGVCDCQ